MLINFVYSPYLFTCLHILNWNRPATRCPPRDPNAKPGLEVGGLNKMFENIVASAPGNRSVEERDADSNMPPYTVTVHSRPWTTEEAEKATDTSDSNMVVLHGLSPLMDSSLTRNTNISSTWVTRQGTCAAKMWGQQSSMDHSMEPKARAELLTTHGAPARIAVEKMSLPNGLWIALET